MILIHKLNQKPKIKSMKAPTHKQAILLMIIAPTMWSSAGVLTRQLQSTHSFEMSFWRSLFAALFVILVLFWQHRKHAFKKVLQLGKFGFASGLMWALMFSCFMLALTMTTVANALIVMSLSPLFTSLLAFVFLKQKVVLRTWVVIVIALIGMLWMFVDGFTKLDARGFAGVMLALCVPIAASINVIVIKKGGQVIDLIPAVFVGGVIATIAMLPLAVPLDANLHDIGILAMMGVFQLGLPCMLLVYASKTLSAPEISLMGLIEVLLGPVWVWWVNNEVPASSTLYGGAVVLIVLIFNELSALKLFSKKQNMNILP
jgi:drug/metabolite transporter (DMT)-like permease